MGGRKKWKNEANAFAPSYPCNYAFAPSYACNCAYGRQEKNGKMHLCNWVAGKKKWNPKSCSEALRAYRMREEIDSEQIAINSDKFR